VRVFDVSGALVNEANLVELIEAQKIADKRRVLSRLPIEEITMKLLLYFLALNLQTSAVAETPKTWSEWFTAGTSLVGAGSYRAAAQALRQSLLAAERSGIPYPQLVHIMDSLASAYADAGEYLEAEREWRHALALIEKTEGSESLDYAVLLASVALLPTQIGNHQETIATIRRAIARNAQSGSYKELGVLRGCLAQILVQQKRYAEAEILLSDWQAGLNGSDASGRHQLANLLNCLGGTRYEEGHIAESLQPFRESLNVVEGDVGTEDTMLIVPLNNLATALVKLGRTEEADADFRRATGICGKMFGDDHPTCGVLLANYAVCLRKLGRKQEAKEEFATIRRVPPIRLHGSFVARTSTPGPSLSTRISLLPTAPDCREYMRGISR
jgi:tetratricopeptide (TPR) repeat protein